MEVAHVSLMFFNSFGRIKLFSALYVKKSHHLIIYRGFGRKMAEEDEYRLYGRLVVILYLQFIADNEVLMVIVIIEINKPHAPIH